MRIGVNVFILREHIGGMRQYFFNVFNELLLHDRDNEYVFFYCDANVPELDHLRTDHWRQSSIRITDQHEIRSHLDRIDLYFCPFGALYPAPMPLPTVVKLSDIQEMYYPSFFSPHDLYMRALFYPSSTRMATHVITISQFSKRSIEEHHFIRPDKISIAYECADSAFYDDARHGQKPAGRIPERYIFFPGNFWQHKNHETLLHALRILQQRGSCDIKVVLTGHEQSNGYPIQEKVRAYGLAEQVQYLGYLSLDEIIYLYRRATMLVFPSLFEGFGIPVVEAMASGCPVIAANSSSIPEIAGDSAILFEPENATKLADAISRVWVDRALRDELATRGRARAGHFSAGRSADSHKEAFAKAAQNYSYANYVFDRLAYANYHRAKVEIQRRFGTFDRRARQSTGAKHLSKDLPQETANDGDHDAR